MTLVVSYNELKNKKFIEPRHEKFSNIKFPTEYKLQKVIIYILKFLIRGLSIMQFCNSQLLPLI